MQLLKCIGPGDEGKTELTEREAADMGWTGHRPFAPQCCTHGGECRRVVDGQCIAGVSNWNYPHISQRFTFPDAQQYCAARGLTLCHQTCSGTGCMYNFHPVFTGERCYIPRFSGPPDGTEPVTEDQPWNQTGCDRAYNYGDAPCPSAPPPSPAPPPPDPEAPPPPREDLDGLLSPVRDDSGSSFPLATVLGVVAGVVVLIVVCVCVLVCYYQGSGRAQTGARSSASSRLSPMKRNKEMGQAEISSSLGPLERADGFPSGKCDDGSSAGLATEKV